MHRGGRPLISQLRNNYRKKGVPETLPQEVTNETFELLELCSGKTAHATKPIKNTASKTIRGPNTSIQSPRLEVPVNHVNKLAYPQLMSEFFANMETVKPKAEQLTGKTMFTSNNAVLPGGKSTCQPGRTQQNVHAIEA